MNQINDLIIKSINHIPQLVKIVFIIFISLFLGSVVCAQNSFLSRILEDPDIEKLGDDAFNIINGEAGFETNFAKLADELSNCGSKLDDIFDVTDFGAKNDGSGDASIGINAAYQAVKDNGGGTVMIPAGKYQILNQLKPVSNSRTIATNAILDRAFHNSTEPSKSNNPGSGLILASSQTNFSWQGGIITNGGGVCRGRAFEVMNCSDFNIGQLEIYYQGSTDAGEPTSSVGLFFTSCFKFYLHDLHAEAAYPGDEKYPESKGNTPFRFADCNHGVIYNLEGTSGDNIIDLTAVNKSVDYQQHDILVLDVDGHQKDIYGRSSAIICGTAGSQGLHMGDHYNLYFIDITHDSSGDKTQPIFEVMNSSEAGASVHDIHFVGVNAELSASEILKLYQKGDNKGIRNIFIKKSVMRNIGTEEPAIRIYGDTDDIYIDSESIVEGSPNIQLINSDATVHVDSVSSNLNYFKKNKNVKVYPNPFRNRFNICFSTPEFGLASINVYDLNGRKVFSSTKSIQKNIDLYPTGLHTGTYLLEVNMTNQRIRNLITKL